jgi:hypothetical protein
MAIALPLRARRVQSASALVVFLAVCACNYGATKPLGVGDDLTVDVDATGPPPALQFDAAASDGEFGYVDGPYGILAADAYDPIAACSECACPAGTYCFPTGGTGQSVSSGTCHGGADSGGQLGVGCVPLPGACTNEPDCSCLLREVAPGLSCVPVCVDTSTFAVYCPTP